MQKKKLLTIDECYAKKYHLDDIYIGKSIVMYDDRYEHMKKHALEFSTKQEYQEVINNIEYIVNSPDFISIDKNKKGMYFIKTLNDNIMVVVRIANTKELKVRTLYPINNTKRMKLIKKKD